MIESLLEAFQKHITTQPDALFSIFLGQGACQYLTYGTLGKRAAAYANLFRRKGLKRGNIVLIILQHCPDLYFAFMGALLCECVPSFMPFPSEKQDPIKYWQSHKELFQRIGAGAIVTYPENIERIREYIPSDGLCCLILAEEAGGEGESFLIPRPNPEQTAFLQHSSGTTGLKKGVELSYGAVAEQIASYAAVLQLVNTDRIATWLPLYHDMGLIACFILPLTLGLTIVSMDAFEWIKQPELLLHAIDVHGCTHVWLPNFAFHHLCLTAASESRCDLSAVKAFIDCSEPCKPDTFDLFLRTFSCAGVRREQLQACYAMAETVFAITQTRMQTIPTVLCLDRRALVEEGRAIPASEKDRSTRLLSVGVPLPGIEVRIVDERGGQAPDGCVGEVAVRGSFLFSGYFKNAKATRDSFCGEWFRTGDTGLLFDGELYILGRLKELIIIYGKNVYCHDIEAICNRVHGVKKGRCVAAGKYNDSTGSEDLIVIAETEERDLSKWRNIRKDIKSALLREINASPRDIKIVAPGWLIKSTAGKLARGDNLRKYLAGPETEAGSGVLQR